MKDDVLGIDLGTTNSVVATLDSGGNAVVLRNVVDRDTTPSVVYFESGDEVVVGEEARQLLSVDPANGVSRIKRHMGTDHPLEFWGRQHTPESISALILKQLVAAATDDESVRVVVTVPAYFGLAEREATAQAARIAGLEVLELLDEPVAAAMHYGLTAPGRRTVLVYDLGGGTFDTTVIDIANGQARVVATAGHHELGGSDVDDRLLELVLTKLEEQLPEDEFERFAADSTRITSLMIDLERAKCDLSSRMAQDIVVRAGSSRTTIKLMRDELEAICVDLFDSTHEIIRQVLADAAAKGAGSIDEVIMVGGSSRIPLLSEQLRAQVGVTPRLVDPDLAVAKGAALRAHELAGTAQIAALNVAPSAKGISGLVTPVAPRAVGILIQDSFDPEGTRTFIAHLVGANSPLPCEKRTTAYGTISTNQESVRIQVFEQAGSVASEAVEHNRRVMDGELTGLGDLAAGSVIEVTLAIAVDGRLTVVAREPRSGRSLTLEAYVEGVVDTQEAERLAETVGLTAVRG
jgi:molecular chaperone DnaK